MKGKEEKYSSNFKGLLLPRKQLFLKVKVWGISFFVQPYLLGSWGG